MRNVFEPNKIVTSKIKPVSLFPDQLPREPSVSRIYVDSFDNEGVYHAARRQNSSFYEEGRDRLVTEKTRKGIAEALKKL